MTKLAVAIAEQLFEVEIESVSHDNSELWVRVNGERLRVITPELEAAGKEMEWMIIDDRPYEISLDRDLHWIAAGHGLQRLNLHDLDSPVIRPPNGDGRLKAPIPGLITRVLVSPGQSIESGQPLVVLEAMKMENEIRAPRSGVVAAVHVNVGQSVVRDEILIEVAHQR